MIQVITLELRLNLISCYNLLIAIVADGLGSELLIGI